MNTTAIHDFMNRLNLDVAVESVASNPNLPRIWQDGASHYRAIFIRPGVRECHFQFSHFGAAQHWPALYVFYLVASEIGFYERHPVVEDWCAETGHHIEDIAPVFHSFAEDQMSLMMFFGEFYQEFLALGGWPQ